MAGYIGSKAVNLSTTGADINGDANIDGDLSFGDNDKAVFGAGSDLQIYHDGSNSYIVDNGTGDLHLSAANFYITNAANTENHLSAIDNGAVSIYYDGSVKLATTSTGVDITGTLVSDGLTVDGDITLTAGDKLKFNDDRYFTPENNVDGAEVSANGIFRVKTGATPVARLLVGGNGDISFYEDTGTTAKFFWDASAESLGIGTSSPATALDLNTLSGNSQLRVSNGTYYGYFGIDSAYAGLDYAAPSGGHRFRVGGSFTEAMRIDSSGNLLVGKTVTTFGNDGHVLWNDGLVDFSRTATSTTMRVNKNTHDGDLISFNKNGTTVGSISADNNYLTIAGAGGYGINIRSDGGAPRIIPRLNNGAADNAIDLGDSGSRYDDIYATNGTIQTSDRNEKQDIAELSEAEQRVAVAAKGLLRKFRWKDAVAEKGDEARTHFGIIAQDLQAAFAAEGLDAGDYAMFISSTWTDEETSEERTRMGVRYSELLAFIIGAL